MRGMSRGARGVALEFGPRWQPRPGPVYLHVTRAPQGAGAPPMLSLHFLSCWNGQGWGRGQNLFASLAQTSSQNAVRDLRNSEIGPLLVLSKRQ